MARGATVNLDELPEERQAEIAEQARQHEEEAERWNALFEGLDERVLTPKMTAIADELSDAGKWMGDTPTSETRLSGTGIKSAGQFQGVIDGRERPVDLDVELFPSSNGRFIAYMEVGGRVERETYEADEFQGETDEQDERLRKWLDTQFERHVRGKAFA